MGVRGRAQGSQGASPLGLEKGAGARRSALGCSKEGQHPSSGPGAR